MDSLMADLSDRLVALHASMNDALTGLPPEALVWIPGPEMNSLAVLVSHTAGAERYWIGDVAGQEPSGRVRAEEFRASADSAAELVTLLDNVLAHSQKVLARLSRDQLDEMRESPLHDRPFRVSWALAHALEHTSVHTGHIELTRQLWDQHSQM